MRIVGLSLDNSILNKNSSQAKRVIEYGDLVEGLDFIVLGEKNQDVVLSEKVRVFCLKTGNKIFSLFKIFSFAKKFLKKEKTDVITVQDQYYLAFVAYLLAKKFNISFEVQIHGFEKFAGLRKIIARYVIPRADAVRVVSVRLKNQLIEEFGISDSKIIVAPIYTEVQSSKLKVKSLRPEIKNLETGEKFIFLTTGRLVPVKNINMQIEAIEQIARSHPFVELWIVGEGPESEKLKVKSKKLRIEDKVRFFGWQKNLENFYSQADAFLLTSDYEGWGMVIIEAASFGLPIIMTDVGCAGELIINEENGLIVSPGDKNGLLEAMVRVIDDKKMAKKIGQGARQAVLKLPSKNEIMSLYKQSWQKAAAKNE